MQLLQDAKLTVRIHDVKQSVMIPPGLKCFPLAQIGDNCLLPPGVNAHALR